MGVSVEEFLDCPSQSLIQKCRRTDLIEIAKHYNLSFPSGIRKQELRNILVEFLVDENILPEEALDLILEIKSEAVRLKELDIQFQREMEEKRLEMERVKEERDREARISLEREKMSLEAKLRETELASREKLESTKLERFDPTKNVRFVPQFDEKEVDKFFLLFEKVATDLNWPIDKYTILLQSVLKGKARDVYTSLPIEQSSNYKTVKQAILKAYELVPEAYRQKFRNFHKAQDKTYVEFAGDKERLFDRWCSSEKVGSSFEKLRQLILVEEFKNSLHPAVKTYINEQKADSLGSAAKLADDYTLLHKSSFNKSTPQYNIKKQFFRSNSSSVIKGTSNTPSRTSNPNSQGTLKKEDVARKSNLFCAYCKNNGHIISECEKLKKKQEAKTSSALPNAVTSLRSRPQSPISFGDIPEINTVEPEAVMNGYRPFLSDGTVSLLTQGSEEIPIQILRDSGALQSVLLTNVLPFNEESFTGKRVLIENVDCDVSSLPLHRVNLRSDLVSGPVTVAVKASLPIQGVQLLLGNDLAGGKMVASPIVTETPNMNVDLDPIEEEIPDLYPSCAVTRAMNRMANVEVSKEKKLPSDCVYNLADTCLHKTFAEETDPSRLTQSPLESSDCRLGTFKPHEGCDEVSSQVPEKDLSCDLARVSNVPRLGTSITESTQNTSPFEDSALRGFCSSGTLSSQDFHEPMVLSPKDSGLSSVPLSTKADSYEHEGHSNVPIKGNFIANDRSSMDFNRSGPGVQSSKETSGIQLFSRERLVAEQANDRKLSPLLEKALQEDEIFSSPVCYYKRNGVLMRKWRPPDVPADAEWAEKHQVVLPKAYYCEALTMAHETPLAGHLGVNKTYHKLLDHFYWPQMKKDVSEFCRSCHTCQMVGKPNQSISHAPLHPIPAFGEPFSRIIIDCVGPLPKTKSGNEFLLTIMCASTRFPEAIPLRNIKAKTIIKALVKFFTLFGLPMSIQSDQGSNFMSNIFQQVMHELNIKQYRSSPYHPESQGALERFHQTLKNMIKCYCYQTEKDWDEGIHFLLFAAREAVQDSLGYSPFELVFGHSVRGPLKLMKEQLLAEDDASLNLLNYVSDFKLKLSKAFELAQNNLRSTQNKMKARYDKSSKERQFEVGERVLAFLPVSGKPLQARYFGPYTVMKKVSDVNYIVNTPGRRKSQQLCHINMLKPYVERDSTVAHSIGLVASSEKEATIPLHVNNEIVDNEAVDPEIHIKYDVKMLGSSGIQNSDILKNLDSKLEHLDPIQRQQLKGLILEYEHLFPDVPSRTNKIFHDVEVGDSKPVKQHPYRMSPDKQKYLKKEVDYLLENDFIEPSKSAWASPCILVPKPDGSYRMCTDYRKVNNVTKTDSFPIPRIDDCIDKIGKAKYVTKFDLLKGFWQIPLTNRAKEISAFVTPDGLFQYKVMPFGMKNSPPTFQRLINQLIAGIEGIGAYIDDVIVYSDSWDDHLRIIRTFFERLTEYTLTVNLVKSEFGHGTLTFLGHVVGQGQVKPVEAKIQSISDFPVPTNKKQLMRFLGMAGYYRKFCDNFSTITAPLTNLLKKKSKFAWSEDCQGAFDRLKFVLRSSPVLQAPDFQRPFKLAVDASDVGAGAVLLQEDREGVDHPVCYFSKKFNKHQRNYSTVEKECLSLILAIQHFEVYVSSTSLPLVVYTDHNPLTFLRKLKNKNQRLLRWSLLLQEYNLEIRHIKGKENVIADALSRID